MIRRIKTDQELFNAVLCLYGTMLKVTVHNIMGFMRDDQLCVCHEYFFADHNLNIFFRKKDRGV